LNSLSFDPGNSLLRLEVFVTREYTAKPVGGDPFASGNPLGTLTREDIVMARLLTALILFLLAATMSTIGCSGCSVIPSTVQNGPSYFPYVHQRYDMRDTTNGLLTHFECTPTSQVGQYKGELMFCRVWKNNLLAYWNPGYNASSTWVMQHNADDSWSALAFDSLNSIPILGISNYTEVVSAPTCNHGYLAVASPSLVGQTLSETVHYRFYTALSYGPFTEGPFKTYSGPWTSKIRWENVSTPVYSGRALVLEQFEGCNQYEISNPNLEACPHEIDYFAPNIGVVRIDSVWENLVIDRIPL
jgi:hypothetical protein